MLIPPFCGGGGVGRGMALRRGGRLPRRALGRRALSDLPALRLERAEEISQLAEVVECDRFAQQLRSGCCEPPASAAPGLGGLSAEDAGLALDAGFLTFLTHVESRISSAVGHGFYTIGPCGEETMAAVGLALRPTDAMALHYRHLATQITRQLRSGKSVQQVLLDRARAHVVSASDPVTAGVHCSIGGGPNDFIVTSTLASQCPPALGRALGNQLAHGLPGVAKADLPLPKDAVSFVSVGDGSVNNAHFLSAVNLAGYARHRGYKTPIVFAVTNNEVCISLRGHGWLHPFLDKLHMPLFTADGMDLGSVRCCCPPLLSAHSALRRTCVVTRVSFGAGVFGIVLRGGARPRAAQRGLCPHRQPAPAVWARRHRPAARLPQRGGGGRSQSHESARGRRCAGGGDGGRRAEPTAAGRAVRGLPRDGGGGL